MFKKIKCMIEQYGRGGAKLSLSRNKILGYKTSLLAFLITHPWSYILLTRTTVLIGRCILQILQRS